MSAVAAAAVVTAGVTAYSVYKGSKDSEKAFDRADESAQLQYDIAQQQIDLANEQWQTYKDKIFPLELEAQQLGIDAQELAYQRGELDFGIYQDYYAPMQEQFATEAMEGVEAQPERAARDARLEVDKAFDQSEGQVQRSLQRRGVMPGSGADVAGTTDTSLKRAAAKGFAVNRAIEGERDRVEDVNFNRKATALGRQPLARAPVQTPGSAGVNPSSINYSGAAGTAGSVARQYSGMGNTYANAAGDALSGGIQLGMQAYDLYNKYRTPSAFPSGGGYDFAAGGGYGTVPGSQQSTMLAEQNLGFNEGGPVKSPTLQRGYNQGGMVNGPPGVDQVPAYIESPDGNTYDARLTDNEYVIPADVVKRVGTNSLDEIIEKARGLSEKRKTPPNALKRAGGN